MSSDETRDIKADSLIEEMEEERERENRYGLVIGIEEYKNENLNLKYAAKDARKIYELMVDQECGMFPEDNLTLLLNEEATERNIKKAFSWARREVSEKATFWLYYAGHGAPEGENTYWLPHDADVNDLYATGIPDYEIKNFMDGVASERKVLFLDSCYAEATALQDNPTRASVSKDELLSQYKATGAITIASSDGDEKSVELKEYEQGAFTYYLYQGLKGEADLEGDGVVTLKELWDYLSPKVKKAARKAGNKQTPVLKGNVRHGFPLTVNSEEYEKRKKAENIIKKNTGWDGLSKEDGKFLLALLKKKKEAMRENESRLYEVLMSQVEEEEFKITILEGLIENARERQRQKDKSEKKRKCRLVMKTEGKGEVEPEVGIHKYSQDEKIKLRASPNEGWEFGGWEGDISDFVRKELTLDIDEDMEITAVFEKKTCVLDLKINNRKGGDVTPDHGQHEYEYGKDVKIKVQPKDGWQFQEWKGDLEERTSNFTTVKMNKNREIEAVFKRDTYTLEVETKGSGKVKPACGSHEYKYNEEVSLGAKPDSGWEFECWQGDTNIRFKKDYKLHMDRDRKVTAIFKKSRFKLKINKTGAGVVKPKSGSHKFEAFSEVQLKAKPDQGWKFSGWKGNLKNRTSENIAIKMDKDKEIKAVFERKTCVLEIDIGTPEGGIVSPPPGQHEFNYGDKISLKANPNEDWEFAGWRGDISESDKEKVMIKAEKDMKIEAEFARKEFLKEREPRTLKIDKEGKGKVKFDHYAKNIYTGWKDKEKLYKHSLGTIVNKGGFVIFENPPTAKFIQFIVLEKAEKVFPLLCDIPFEAESQPQKNEIEKELFGFEQNNDVSFQRKVEIETAINIIHKFFMEVCGLKRDYEVQILDYDIEDKAKY